MDEESKVDFVIGPDVVEPEIVDYTQGELMDEPCPNCKAKTLYVFAVGNGPDDYDNFYSCSTCNFQEKE